MEWNCGTPGPTDGDVTVRSFIHSFIHSLTHSLTHSLVHSYPFVSTMTEHAMNNDNVIVISTLVYTITQTTKFLSCSFASLGMRCLSWHLELRL